MSLAEIVIVLVVALLCLKPEDISFLIKQVRQVMQLLNNVKNEVFGMLDSEDNNDHHIGEDNIELMNYYLERIVQIDGEYNGEYNINALKSHYNKISQEALNALKEEESV